MKIIKILMILMSLNFLTACNTMNGVGKDIHDLGYFIEDGVSDMKDHVKA